MGWQEQGFDIEVPGFLKKPMWNDTSWSQDTHASFTFIGIQTVVYVRNKVATSDQEGTPLIGVFHQPMDEEGAWEDRFSERRLIYSGDDAAAAYEAILDEFARRQIADYVCAEEVQRLRDEGYGKGKIDFSALHCAFDANEMYPTIPDESVVGEAVMAEWLEFCNEFADRVSAQLKEAL